MVAYIKAKASYRPQPLPPLLADSARRLADSARRLDEQLRCRDDADRIHSLKVALAFAVITLAGTLALLAYAGFPT